MTSRYFPRFKSNINDVPAQLAAGSTLPLVSLAQGDEIGENEHYCPFEHRKVLHPTS
jgi:solute carrier family 36 (proton-coupled amino acid transporter)